MLKKIKSKTRFSIGIIHRNGFDRLKCVLDSAIAVINNNLDEIIVIDNKSTDDSIEKVFKNTKYKNIQIIKNSCNTGYAYSCNQVMKAGIGEYFLLCNNDIELPQNCLDEFERIFVDDPKAGIIGGQILDSNKNKVGSSFPAPTFISELDSIGRVKKSKQNTGIQEAGALSGACLAVRSSTIESAGMMDDDFFFYYEETEWCMRIYKDNWKVLIAPHIKIMHIGGSSTKSFYLESRVEFFRSRLLFWHKVFPRHFIVVLYLWNIPKLIIDGCFYLFVTTITLGLNIRMRNKLMDRIVVIAWLLFGKPNNIGLPDKCHEKTS
jgi:GT2 family glycosyltransferase